ncbi:MAG: hypothetical protein ACREM6_10245 [Vulcanimicrobiaceae bacterium]
MGLLFTMLAALPVVVRAAPAAVEQRVSAIPAASLLSRNPYELVSLRRQRVADRHMFYDRSLFFLRVLPQILVLYWLWRSGRAARLRDALRRRIRSPAAVRFTFAAVCTILVGLAGLLSVYLDYRIHRGFELSLETPAVFWSQHLVAFIAVVCVAGLATVGVLALVDRTNLWYAYTGVGLFVVVAAWVVVAPLFSFTVSSPLDSGAPLAVRIAGLAGGPAACSGATTYVSDLTGRTDVAHAWTDGFGMTARILIGTTELRVALPNEAAFVAARASARCANAAPLRIALMAALVLALATTGAVLIAERIPFRFDDDTLVRLALVAALIGVGELLLMPIGSGYGRAITARADAAALAATGDRAAAIRSFVRAADERFLPLCPSQLEAWYFYATPPLGTRIAQTAGEPDPCR